jgi:hypothetical protein
MTAGLRKVSSKCEWKHSPENPKELSSESTIGGQSDIARTGPVNMVASEQSCSSVKKPKILRKGEITFKLGVGGGETREKKSVLEVGA